MGKLKERLVTIITARLVLWREHQPMMFEGTLFNSINDAYPDNAWVMMQFVEVQKFPTLNGWWDDHYLLRNNFGEYFVAYFKDRR